MEREVCLRQVDDGNEIAVGAVAHRPSFGLRRLGETVDTFEDTVVDGGLEPSQDAVPMGFDGFGGLDDGRDATMRGQKYQRRK